MFILSFFYFDGMLWFLGISICGVLKIKLINILEMNLEFLKEEVRRILYFGSMKI